MTKVQRVSIVLLVAMFLASIGAWQFAGAQGEKVRVGAKWEYKILSSTTGNELNGLGNDGWELVAVAPSDRLTQFYLKRPR